MLPAIGGTLGVVGTILCLWSLAAFYAPSVVPQLPAVLGPVAPSGQAGAVASGGAIATLPGQRVVSPIEGADVVAPDQQLHANVWHVAFGLCVGVASAASMAEQFPGQFQGAPVALDVAADRTVTDGNASYSVLPADMTLEYAATPEGAYSLTVRDAQSGLGVGCDSSINRIVDR